MSTTPTAKKRGPVSQAIRILYLSFALGVGSFIISSPIAWRLTLSTSDALEAAPPWLALVASLLISNVGALFVSPAVAWVSGLLLFSARPLVVGFGIAASRGAIVYAIDSVSGTAEYFEPLYWILQHLVILGISTGLCTWAYKLGVKRSQDREAARNRELQVSSALANMQFTPVAQETASGAPAALSPADALASAAAAAPPAEAPQPAAAEPAAVEPVAPPAEAAAKPAGDA